MFDIKKIKEKIGLESAENKKKRLSPTVIAVVFILIVLIAGNCLVVFELSYINKFYPGSRIGAIELSGLTKDQAFNLIDQISSQIDQQPAQIEYSSDNQIKAVSLDQIINPDSAYDFFSYDVYKTVYENYDLGRSGNWPQRLAGQCNLLIGRTKLKAYYKLDGEYLKKIILSQLQPLEIKEKNASPKIICANNACVVEIMPENDGQSYDYDQAIRIWSDNLSMLKYQPIKLERIIIKPIIKKTDVMALMGGLQDLFNSSTTPEYFYQDKKWQLSKSSLAKIVDFEKNGGNYYLSINHDAFNGWFDSTIGKDLNIEARNAAIQIKDGQAVSLSSHQNGRSSDNTKAYNDLKSKLNNLDFNDLNFSVIVTATAPDVVTESINELGIKEIIGIGESDFSGSPVNRRKNIKNGADRMQGLLIKPGEDFSLVKNLLPVDASTGYFPEMVIKGNKTTAEYGGGLCQIGTTVFRAALASGLPILERQNHSYNVAYYLENGLPGVDATIYDPKPDLRFRNDTGYYILIQTRISGNKLFFEFWGAKDGRVAQRTTPKTWGIKNPAPAKLIESVDLAPGVKKCTEKAHKGISASFNYIVNYADGHSATTTFTSVYKPWQEVCLIGAAGTSTSALGQ